LELVLQEFELEISERGKAASLDILNKFLIDRYSQNQRAVLIVDEAQNLSQEVMEEIRMISNLQSDKDSLLQIVLVGQPGLRNKLLHPSLAQLRQRIAVSYRLAPLSQEETRKYIAHRLEKAGARENNLFTSEALECVFRHSVGIPRTINIICDAALVYGYADELNTIDSQVIDQVMRDKEEMGPSVASSDVDGISLPLEDSPEDGHLLLRVQSLEERVMKLSAMVEWQIQEHEQPVENYKDRLIHRLETMLANERERGDKLLAKCRQIQHKLNVATRISQKGQEILPQADVSSISEDKQSVDSADILTSRSIASVVNPRPSRLKRLLGRVKEE
jgi:general secretion pathway protein A